MKLKAKELDLIFAALKLACDHWMTKDHSGLITKSERKRLIAAMPLMYRIMLHRDEHRLKRMARKKSDGAKSRRSRFQVIAGGRSD